MDRAIYRDYIVNRRFFLFTVVWPVVHFDSGAFLLPFLLCLLVLGLPLFLLEAALGQFSGKSPYHVWSICPLVKGASTVCSAVETFVLCAYWSKMRLVCPRVWRK